jgi:hypothetical protein
LSEARASKNDDGKMTTERRRSLIAAVSGSRLLGVAARLLASMNAPPDELPRHVIDADVAALRDLVAGSALAAPLIVRLRDLVEARRASIILARASAARERVSGLTAWQQLRAVGIAGLAAAAVTAVATLVDPSPVSGYRWFLWLVLAAGSAVLALAARPLSTALGDSRTLRHLP